MPTLYAITVDTEEEWPWAAGWPTGSPSVTNISAIPRFQSICDEHGAAATYFTNHAVLTDRTACNLLLTLAKSSQVELGMHIHPWNTPPYQGNGRVNARESFLANLPPELIEQKLQTVYDAFQKLGRCPTSFRGGRYSSGSTVQTFLRKRGFLADSSVVPFTAWEDDGGPNYQDRTLEPRRLAPTADANSPLWEIPLTFGFTRAPFAFWNRVYSRIQASWLARMRLIGIADRLNLVRRLGSTSKTRSEGTCCSSCACCEACSCRT